MTHSVILLEHELDLVRDFMRMKAVRVCFEVGHVIVEVVHGRRDVFLEQIVECLFWKHVELAVLCVTRWRMTLWVGGLRARGVAGYCEAAELMRVSSPFVLPLWTSRVCLRPVPFRRSTRRPSGCRGRCLNFQFPRNRPVLSFCQGAGVAVGETVMLLHPLFL